MHTSVPLIFGMNKKRGLTNRATTPAAKKSSFQCRTTGPRGSNIDFPSVVVLREDAGKYLSFEAPSCHLPCIFLWIRAYERGLKKNMKLSIITKIWFTLGFVKMFPIMNFNWYPKTNFFRKPTPIKLQSSCKHSQVDFWSLQYMEN